MKVQHLSLLATILVITLPRHSVSEETPHHLDNGNRTNVPHLGCYLMLNDIEPPHNKLVGKEFENIGARNYKVEREAGATAAKCIDGFAGGYPCNNVDLLSMLDIATLAVAVGSSSSANDIWGWTDTVSGREFAVIGIQRGTAFVEITDPENPIYVGGLPTKTYGSSWRDVKTFGDYAFSVSEASDHGMQIFDLRNLLTASPGTTFNETVHYPNFAKAHNIFINEDTGYAYAVGSNTCSGGLHMVDINDPLNPSFAGCYSDDFYTHDVQCVTYNGPDSTYAGNEICFCSNEDTITVVDVTDKSNITLLSKTGYNDRYTHQGWLTDNHTHFIFNDELDEYLGVVSKTSTHVMDVSDLNSIEYVGKYSGRTNAIDHNNYVKGDYLYQANYRAGFNILKITDVTNVQFQEAGFFDIYPESDSNNFNGAWSNYPYFPSGNIVISGIEQGLFVLKFNGDEPLDNHGNEPLDNPDWSYTRGNGKEVDCGWVAGWRPDIRCKKVGFIDGEEIKASDVCRAACSDHPCIDQPACDGDNPDWVHRKSNGRNKGCDWVRKRFTRKRCRNKVGVIGDVEVGYLACDACCESCSQYC